jgi:hypothetical protein
VRVVELLTVLAAVTGWIPGVARADEERARSR